MTFDPRNRNLNSAYRPKWAAAEDIPTVNPGASGDTQFDPLLGTGMGEWLDSIGAKAPGGARLAGGMMPKDAGPVSQRLDLALAGLQGGGYVGDSRKPGRQQLDAELLQRFPGVR